MPYISPERFSAASAYELLQAAAEGYIRFDQRLVHALVDEPDRTLPDILRFIGRDDFPPELIDDIAPLLRYLNPPEAVSFYIEAIKENVNDVSEQLAEAVIAAGGRMLEPLLELYAEVGQENGADIAFLLASLGVRDPRILKILLDRLADDPSDTALAVGVYGDPAALPQLERILGEASGDKRLTHAIENAISDIRAFPGRIPDIEPVDVYDQYPEELEPDLSLLTDEERLDLLNSTSVDTRREAAASCREALITPAVRSRLLELATTDSDPQVRGSCWEALATLDEQPDITENLRSAARSGQPAERAGAVIGLAGLAELDEETLRIIEELYEIPEIRDKALEAMWKSLDRRFEPYIVRHVNDPEVSPNVVLGIGYLGLSSQTNRLLEWFEDPFLRPFALIAYALAAPVDVTRARMKPLLRRIDQLANGLALDEGALVRDALDQRLKMRGLDPVFESDFAPTEPEPVKRSEFPKTGRNEPCPCGSGKKFKKCHGA